MQLCTVSSTFYSRPVQVNLAKNHWDDECDTMVSLRSWLMADGIIVVGPQLCICLPEEGSRDRSHTLA